MAGDKECDKPRPPPSASVFELKTTSNDWFDLLAANVYRRETLSDRPLVHCRP